MALTKAIEKLKKYYKRLEAGDVKKIKPSHINKVMNKLSKKEEILLEELSETTKASKKKRLQQKLDATRKQIDRSQWLLKKIS